MILDTEQETLPREELRELQVRRLRATVERCYQTVKYYRDAMDELGVRPSHIQSVADVRLLPFTKKENLRENYPFGMFAVPTDQVVRIHASSGTTGKPTVVGYTRRDVRTWARVMARSLAAAGLHPGERLHNAYGYGLFTGGLGFHYGAEELGVMVTPISGGQTQRQIMLIQDFEPTGLSCTPSYALNLAEAAADMNVDLRKLPLKVGIFGAEPWTEEMRYELESRLGIDAVDIYGLSEIIGPGVATECIEAKNGLHVFEDHFLIEAVDVDTGEPIPYGEAGEIVITSLTKEAFPVLRYRTRDVSVLDPAPCRCGRTHVRMKRVTGRTDDMLIIRGVNVFPSQVEAILMQTETLAPFYQLEVSREGNLDLLTVNVEGSPPLVAQGDAAMARVAQKAQKDIKDFIGVTAKVAVKRTGELPRSEGKAVRVIDRRKK
ncbi:MAG: phenylacetate--CoA ligase [Candidatus Competibacteraceae bacterium]|nr:phenylacetate--CoA ligase [Candidatus Competibacteraceae bacterium]MBK7982953.1 phenylacetate--CoA ligase [Candidatus Competibacteraceae bacterium]MBK8898495.1 phenylacetate--CoA ligase [Candidatus Competibacteraceae bacterium]MBK8962304.1 phenylacetate--CoA ligase [Candidatus Competibacteraceae bacterium]MBK9951523.1 phenylacetate--CoA ligase [Candidatus Competibacteraceae bacterium]